jgi:hypothetical protein
MNDDQNQQPAGDEAAAAAAAAQAAAAAAALQPAGSDLNVSTKTEFVLSPSGDPATDLAFKFLAANGVTPGTAAWDAAQKGEFAVVKAALAEKGVKGGAEYVAILEDKASKAVTAAKEKQTLVQTAVHTAVGGQENWNTVKAWVAANATDSELAAVNTALKSGDPFIAKVMAEGLASRHARATGQSAQGTEPTALRPMTQARAPAGGPANAALTGTEYRAEVQKLQNRLGSRMDASPEFAALRARRSAGIAAERG